MARSNARSGRAAPESFLECLQYFLTPLVWKQAHQALDQRLGTSSHDGSSPQVWVTALVHLSTGLLWAWRLGRGRASERNHLVHLLPTLPRSALLVADAGYVGYTLMQTLLRRQILFLIR